MRSIQYFVIVVVLLSLPLETMSETLAVKLTRQFPTESNPSIKYRAASLASPLLDVSTKATPQIIVPTTDGTIVFIDAETGQKTGQAIIPGSPDLQVFIASTPVKVGNNLIVLYQMQGKGGRQSHRVAVVDISTYRINPNFPILELSAEKPQADGKAMVKFDPAFAYSRSEVKHAKKMGSKLGFSYVSFGNAGDIQPFHGWLFEIDMDAWKNKGVKYAIKNVLLTTPESQCNVTVEAGTREMICGGGIWAPAGSQVEYNGDDYELLVPTGNGQLDLGRQNYANTLMRVKPGLEFNPECDVTLCKNFNPVNPALACIQSCKNLFIPRLKPGDKPIKPVTGECDQRSFAECVAWMDYDLGANAPVKIKLNNKQSVIVQASKEGAVYLLDADHLGTMFDRKQLIETCGTKKDPCKLSWRGMMVTHPVVSKVDGTPLVIIPTFVSDESHIAGIIALKIISNNGKPHFEPFWQYPEVSDPDALKKFRSAPTLPLITTLEKHGEVVWVVDIGDRGILYGIRIKDGKLIAKKSMVGSGIPLSRPVALGNKIYFTSSKAVGVESYLIEE